MCACVFFPLFAHSLPTIAWCGLKSSCRAERQSSPSVQSHSNRKTEEHTQCPPFLRNNSTPPSHKCLFSHYRIYRISFITDYMDLQMESYQSGSLVLLQRREGFAFPLVALIFFTCRFPPFRSSHFPPFSNPSPSDLPHPEWLCLMLYHD